MKFALAVTVMASALALACGDKQDKQNEQPSAPTPATPTPESTTPAATTGSQPINTEIDVDKECAPFVSALKTAALAEGACTADTECAIRPIGLCNVDGLGCYWMAHNKGQSKQPVKEAMAAYVRDCGVLAKCDCANAPTSAVCRDGQCVPK